jgi:hypothetical protein
VLIDGLRSLQVWNLDAVHQFFWPARWLPSFVFWSAVILVGTLLDHSAHLVGRVRAFASLRGYIIANTTTVDRQPVAEPSLLLRLDLDVHFCFSSVFVAIVRLAVATVYLLVALLATCLLLIIRFPWTFAILTAISTAVGFAADEQDENDNEIAAT